MDILIILAEFFYGWEGCLGGKPLQCQRSFDRLLGANGGLIGADARVLEYVPNPYIDITGINDNEVPGLPITEPRVVRVF